MVLRKLENDIVGLEEYFIITWCYKETQFATRMCALKSQTFSV